MRRHICLNGEWRFVPDDRGRSPEATVLDCRWEPQPVRVPSSWRWIIEPEMPYQPYDLFAYPRAWNEAESGVLGRTFTVRHRPGERIFLRLDGVLQRSAVFVNGHKALESSEGFLPLVADVTALVHEGENDLKVWCGPFPAVETPAGPRDLAPDGSWWARMARGIWQDVFLEYRPACRIEDVYVVTSVRERTLTLQVEVANDGDPCPAMLRATVFDAATPVKVLAGEPQVFAGGQVARVQLSARWDDPRLWSPEQPHLYTLRAELVAGDRVLDRVETRFGFREVWLDGPNFILNGTRINLRGDAWHYQGFVQQTRAYAENWYRACRATGINWVRLHAMPFPAFYLDVADEMGMLITDESAIYGSAKRIQADHPDFLAQCRRHLRDLVRRDRNHPSVIIWSMQNEMRWVDGREGYSAAMPELAQVMRELDGTRPISYDGDMRLLPPEALEILSVHYNLDGTVEGWHRDKPLMFGEHGKWHYVSPLTSCSLVGPAAYLSFDACQENMGWEEALFIEHARREGVTGVCPFNMVNYMLCTFPATDVPLAWDDLTTPGVKPARIPAHTLTVDNGLLRDHPQPATRPVRAEPEHPACTWAAGTGERSGAQSKDATLARDRSASFDYGLSPSALDAPLDTEPPHRFVPNPSWRHVRAAFAPVAIMPDEYDTAFYGGRMLPRTFSVYNDTEAEASVQLVYRLEDRDGTCLDHGEAAFRHPPGERVEWRHAFPLPDVAEPTAVRLTLTLYHSETRACERKLTYRVHPARALSEPLDTAGRVVAYLGGPESLRVLRPLIPELRVLAAVGEPLDGVDLLVIGKDFGGDAAALQAWLAPFVAAGGFLLMLEQSSLALGDLTLAGRAFHAAHRNEPEHPVFAGLTEDDLRFWGAANPCRLDAAPLVFNAFEKPVQGDFRTLLECGDGDFGRGGLLWTPLIEYRIGRGRALLCQVAVTANTGRVPAAATLLRNMLAYGLHADRDEGRNADDAEAADHAEKSAFLPRPPCRLRSPRPIIEVGATEPALAFFSALGVDIERAGDAPPGPSESLVIVDPSVLCVPGTSEVPGTWVDALLHVPGTPEVPGAWVDALRNHVAAGGCVLVLPAAAEHAAALSALLGAGVTVEPAETCQVQPLPHALTRGLSVHDLYHLEKISYAPPEKVNSPIACHALRCAEADVLFTDVHAPWHRYFASRELRECQKNAIANIVVGEPFEPRAFGVARRVGRGWVVLSQLLLPDERQRDADYGIKLRRVYARLLANLGADVRSPLFTHVKAAQDVSAPGLMALIPEPQQDAVAVESFFADPRFALNALGETPFGRMRPVERQAGAICVAESRGRTCFLTTFIESEINRDPSRRAADELPDSSIVPDLRLGRNCAVRVYVNGRPVADLEQPAGDETVTVPDVPLWQGLNRLALVCRGGGEDIRLSLILLDKRGGPAGGIKYQLTLS